MLLLVRKKNAIYFLFAILSWGSFAFAQQDSEDDKVLYYDADDLSIDTSSGNISAKGNVLFLIGDVFISADKATYLKSSGLVRAEGDLKVLRKNETIFASDGIFSLATDEMRLNNVLLTADPASQEDAGKGTVLGFSPAELAFETSRNERAVHIEEELRILREQYVNQKNLQRIDRSNAKNFELNEISRRYAQLLERLMRTKLQPNLVFDSLPENEKIRTEKRRDAAQKFAIDNKNKLSKASGLQKVPGYIQMRAASLYKRGDGNYELKSTTLTPCKCEPGTPPIYGLSARTVEVEPEQYLTLKGATLDLFTVPAAYVPWVKMPIKTKRETGLLLPSFFGSRSGSVSSQPVFITLGDHADTTVTVNYFSERGLRIDDEIRYQISPRSRLRLYGEVLNDSKFQKEYDAALLKIERETAGQSEEIQSEARLKVGKELSRRWFTQGSINYPVTSTISAKLDGEFVSDNRYLSDLGQDTAVASQDIFAPQQNSFRFLTQEAAVEYYGSDISLTLKAQGLHDVFALAASDTPVRLPRVEVRLLPKRFFDLPLAFGGDVQWERVQRLNGKTSFVDLESNMSFENNDAPPAPQQIKIKNNARDANEPFISGDRSQYNSRVWLPLPANNYLNASLEMRNSLVQYSFPDAQPYKETSPYQAHAAYVASAHVPLYTILELRTEDATSAGLLRHNITPFAEFSYIPDVHLHGDYPLTSHLFYEGDAAFTQQKLTFGVNTDWIFSRQEFAREALDLKRVNDEDDIGIANEEILDVVLRKNKISFDHSAEEFLSLSGSLRAPKIFQDWANEELEAYDTQAVASDAGKFIAWPERGVYRSNVQWQMQPFSLQLKTSYNFQAERTTREVNLRSGAVTQPPEAWGDLEATSTWSAHPWLPLSGGFYGTWHRPYHRWSKAGATISGATNFGLSLSYSNGYEIKPDPARPKSLVLDRTIGIESAYTPKNWIRFLYQFERKIFQTAPSDNNELSYKALQSISFIGLQDCMDVALVRYKSYEVPEYLASYAIALNVKFLGYSRNFADVGNVVDRTVKSHTRSRN